MARSTEYLLLTLLVMVSCQYCTGQVNETECLCLQDMLPEGEVRGIVRMALFPDGSGRMLLAELATAIWLYYPNFTREPVPFANLSGDPDYYLLGLTLHPNFPEDGRMFVNINKAENGEDHYVTLLQYSIDPENVNTIDMESEVVIIEKSRDPEGFNDHYGGEVFFGVDGYLYTAFGDGTQGDPLYMSQNRSDFRGKVLRLNVDNVPEGANYTIPPDNPFLDDEDTLPEIYALGLRQPWTVSMDSGDPETGEGRGRVFIADCGQKSYEEVSLLTPGGNYGWSSREGLACYRYRYCGQIGPEELPIATYSHEGVTTELDQRCVIGGHVYRGELNPGLTGSYVHTDSGLRSFFQLKQNGNGDWIHKPVPICARETCEELGLTNRFYFVPVSFGLDPQGELFLSSSSVDTLRGRIQKLVDPATYNPEDDDTPIWLYQHH